MYVILNFIVAIFLFKKIELILILYFICQYFQNSVILIYNNSKITDEMLHIQFFIGSL